MRTVCSVVLVLFAACTLTVGLRADDKGAKKEITLKGTILCAKCALKEAKKCQTALQVKEGDKTVTYYFDDKGMKEEYHEPVCGGDRKEGTVIGTVHEHDGKKWITPKKVEYKKADAKLNELLKERLATLRGLVKLLTEDYQAGRVSFDRVQQATRALLNAELAQCESDKERIKVLEKIVALTKESEKNAVQRYKTGNAPQSDVLTATAGRLEAEIALKRAKSKADPSTCCTATKARACCCCGR